MIERVTSSSARKTESHGAGQLSSRVAGAISWAIFAIGAIYFVWAAAAAAYSPSMDYAVVVEMARNMASGKDFPVFFYGQAYMGSLEPAVSALICALFGPSPFCVCLGTTLLGIATLLVTMQVGRRLAGEWGGVFSLALAVTGGYYWIHFMVSPRGGYALASLLVISPIALASTCDFTDGETRRIRLSPSLFFGFMAGLAFWNFWITLPAFAAAGLILVFRLRWRVFSPRFILPCLLSFLAGSAPWWSWAVSHGAGALDFGESQLKPLGWRAIGKLTSVVFPIFYSTSQPTSLFWRTLLPWVLVVLLLLSLAAILAGRDRSPKRFLVATLLYTALFAVLYANSSFGSMGAARYLVPFVPVFSALCGSAMGLLLCGPDPASFRPWRIATAVLVSAVYAGAVALPAVRTTIDNLTSLRLLGQRWKADVDVAASDPSLAEAAFADFSLFGYNWASDRKICLVSPSRWRYGPYLQKLEEAEHPAVVNQFHSFETFVKASGGTCRTRPVGRIRISDNITPPRETEEVPATAEIRVRTNDGSDVGGLLLDDNLATDAKIRAPSGKNPFLDVDFPKTPAISGVSILMDHFDCARGWRIDFIDPEGNITLGIDDNPHQGWFWSGPRPYQFGPEARWTIRWPTGRVVSGIRITFASRVPGSLISIPDLRLLTDKPLSSLDIDAVKQAVATAKQGAPDVQIHAGRWLGRQLGGPDDPALTFGQSSDNLGVPDICKFVTLDRSLPNLAIFRDPAIANAASNTLRSCGAEFTVTETGGCHILHIFPTQGAHADTTPLRIIGGHLMRDAQQALDTARHVPLNANFGDIVSVLGTTPIPPTVHPGEKLKLEVICAFPGKGSGKGSLLAFAHAIQNDRIAFQAATAVHLSRAKRPADLPHHVPLTLDLTVPTDMPEGDVSFAICIKKDRPFSLRLIPTGDNLAVSSRRVIFGHAKVAKE